MRFSHKSKTYFSVLTILLCVFLFAACQEEHSCFDGKQNQGERGIDCGDDVGLCPSCEELQNDPNDPNDLNDPNNPDTTSNNTIIEHLTYYQIEIEGTIFSTNFNRSACLYLSPGIVAAGEINLNNGENPVDVGLVSGFPAGFPEPGAMWFFSNTAMCQYGSTGCNSIPINTALDVCFITATENNGITNIKVELDGEIQNNAAAGSVLTANGLNHFTATNNIAAALWNLTTGEMNLEISEDSNSISGSFDLVGSTHAGTAPTTYTATFSGQKADIEASECL